MYDTVPRIVYEAVWPRSRPLASPKSRIFAVLVRQQHYVGGLKVAVNDPRSMRSTQASSDLLCDTERVGEGQRAIASEPRIQGLAVIQRHRIEEQSVIRLTGLVCHSGSATMAPDGDRTTHVRVHLANATPGGEHLWGLHRGQCDYDEGRVGEASA